MQCIRPIKAGYDSTLTKIVYKSLEMTREMDSFQFDCRKCLPCRLNHAREKAIRATHEASLYTQNIFLTLTYADEHLTSPKLVYRDFQLFMKKLRKTTDNKITCMVTGEYGELNKRPHWHAIIFNYSPPDQLYYRTTDRGDTCYKSALIDRLWGKNDPIKRPNEIGAVTIESASYVARYGAKKLVHGFDQDHDFHPIHRTPSKRGMGRSWIEKYYNDTFNHGFVVVDGTKMAIPRYYEDWLKKYKPELFKKYLPKKLELQQLAINQSKKEELQFLSELMSGKDPHTPRQRSKVKETILKSKFKLLQEKLKL